MGQSDNQLLHEIVDHLRDDRADVLGLREERLSSAIDRSQFAGYVGERLASMDSGIESLGLALGVRIAAITRELAASRAVAEHTAAMLARPKSTAAQEHYQRGVRALSMQWMDEAIDDFRAAIELDRYFAPSHALLAVALVSADRTEEAVEPLRLAIRYGLADAPSIAAGSALLGARLLKDQGRPRDASVLIDQASPLFVVCPDLVVARANVSGADDGLRAALSIAPEMALVLDTRLQPFAQLVDDLTADPAGPVPLARMVCQLVAEASLLIAHLPPDAPAVMSSSAAVSASGARVISSEFEQWGRVLERGTLLDAGAALSRATAVLPWLEASANQLTGPRDRRGLLDLSRQRDREVHDAAHLVQAARYALAETRLTFQGAEHMTTAQREVAAATSRLVNAENQHRHAEQRLEAARQAVDRPDLFERVDSLLAWRDARVPRLRAWQWAAGA